MEEKPFHCDTCNSNLDVVHVDGYPVGDRLLENVIFIIRNDNGKPKTIGVTEECQSYFKRLNKNYWFREMNKYAANLDYTTCHVCSDGEVPVWGVKNNE